MRGNPKAKERENKRRKNIWAIFKFPQLNKSKQLVLKTKRPFQTTSFTPKSTPNGPLDASSEPMTGATGIFTVVFRILEQQGWARCD